MLPGRKPHGWDCCSNPCWFFPPINLAGYGDLNNKHLYQLNCFWFTAYSINIAAKYMQFTFTHLATCKHSLVLLVAPIFTHPCSSFVCLPTSNIMSQSFTPPRHSPDASTSQPHYRVWLRGPTVSFNALKLSWPRPSSILPRVGQRQCLRDK